jgi:hypothetical protein
MSWPNCAVARGPVSRNDSRLTICKYRVVDDEKSVQRELEIDAFSFDLESAVEPTVFYQAADSIVEKLRDCIVVSFVDVKDDSSLLGKGSAFFARYKGTVFLITACHVAETSQTNNRRYFGVGDLLVAASDLDFAVDLENDLAIAVVSEQWMFDRKLSRIGMLALELAVPKDSRTGVHVVVGFPESKNYLRKRYKTDRMEFLGISLYDIVPAPDAVTISKPLCFSLRRKNTWFSDGRLNRNMIPLHGLSGGPVVELTAFSIKSRMYFASTFAGVACEWIEGQNVIVATAGEAVIELIESMKDQLVTFSLSRTLRAMIRSSEKRAEVIAEALRNRTTILVCGEPNSGRTTFLNSLISQASLVRAGPGRLVTIEEAQVSEFHTPPGWRVISLRANVLQSGPSGPVISGFRDLVSSLLDFGSTIDLFVIGEINTRDAAEAFLLAWEAGFRGLMATIPGPSVEEALERLTRLLADEDDFKVRERIASTQPLVLCMKHGTTDAENLSDV